ncbi:MAG TPA: hypothetical protein DDW52_29155 [Planctomycetaceae bacterium]|nr:hypothetical protein [Planctomycetaceae bacterium]
MNSSELVRRIRATDDDLRMPPEEPLDADQIAILEQWIASGAKTPARYQSSETSIVESDHWSFQPLRDPPVDFMDAGSLGDWAENPIDVFVAAKLNQSGLSPARDARPRAIARRLAYTLTGLPPTKDEVLQFEARVERMGFRSAIQERVEQLLSQHSYGERWGRHWMDWVRYADTAGDNSDFPIPQAYLYRNYIVDSLNADIPYDQFLREQIAGDRLPASDQAERNRLNIATGYLAMARRFGSLIERYPWHLTIEDTIDNIGRTTMGLTLACARCHDHKFDPISTRDYYGLYGIFESTQYPFPGIELFQTQKDLVPLVSREVFEAKIGPHAEKREKLEVALNKLLSESQAMAQEHARLEPESSLAEIRKMREKLDKLLLKVRNAGKKLSEHIREMPQLPMAYAVQDGPTVNARIQIKGEPTRPGAQVPRKFPDVLGAHQVDPSASGSGRLELAQWIASKQNPLTARVIVNRVWQRHFGEGLVRSTSDFGLRGEQPSHPDLLDWLAQRFIDSGWSLKALHRMILSSHTYRLASLDNPEALAIDPENRLLWKFPRQRLDAESIRDTLLVLSRQLDAQPQVDPYPIPPQKEWKYTQHHPFKDDYPTQKRSLYQMTKRLTVGSYMQTFDGPDPNACTSGRDQSVTPLQALYFVNDDFLHASAQAIAEQMLSDETVTTDSERFKFLFGLVLAREPTSDESELLGSHLQTLRERADKDSVSVSTSSVQQRVWASVTRSLLRLNEFLYLD